jgi:hypothetical protein
VSDGDTTITLATCGSRMRAISQALPVTSSATWSRTSRLCANSSSVSGLVSIRPPERSSACSTSATSQKSRWTSSAHCSQFRPPLVTDWKPENRWANDIDGSALAAQPGKSHGRPMKSPGSKPIVRSNGPPSLRSPTRPLVPVDRTKLDRRMSVSLRGTVSCPEKRGPSPAARRCLLSHESSTLAGATPLATKQSRSRSPRTIPSGAKR